MNYKNHPCVICGKEGCCDEQCPDAVNKETDNLVEEFKNAPDLSEEDQKALDKMGPLFPEEK